MAKAVDSNKGIYNSLAEAAHLCVMNPHPRILVSGLTSELILTSLDRVFESNCELAVTSQFDHLSRSFETVFDVILFGIDCAQKPMNSETAVQKQLSVLREGLAEGGAFIHYRSSADHPWGELIEKNGFALRAYIKEAQDYHIYAYLKVGRPPLI